MRDEQSIFLEAIEKRSEQDRVAFLNHACAGDAALRARVEELTAAHERAGGFLESPPPGVTLALEAGGRDPNAALAERPGTTVGRYKLLEQIGEGGMGVVFMAEQTHPVRRRVAIKIVKPGLDTKEVIARFEAERQALALMDHPNIAKVFDAGATDAGRPYFVMELVRGIPITQYCDQQQLAPRQRLELFAQVCRAVQHAHQKGIIHRDLKPNNVLVTVADDGRPVPKVIDFGIAKATTAGQRLTEQTLFTHFQQMIGTPLYMSPEQAEMSAVTDVDTRSDVYSLGVLLYELLTGTTPFDKQRLAKAAYDEVRRILREEEPPRPSTRISTLGQTLTAVSLQRRTDPKRLGQVVRGELDWIVMRALEKDRARRYETPVGLAQDVERYLSDEPVEACPPSRTYRMRKFVRRNKAAMTTTALIAAVLVLATGVSIWQAVRATRATSAALAAEARAGQERDNARAAERQAATVAATYKSFLATYPEQHALRYHWAAMQLYLGEEEEYRKNCRELLERLPQLKTSVSAIRTARVSLLAPNAVDDLAPVMRIVSRTRDDDGAPYHLTKGMALYRIGDFSAAVTSLRLSFGGYSENLAREEPASGDAVWGCARTTATYYLAMAEHQRGQQTAAEEAITSARVQFEALMSRIGPVVNGVGGVDWVIANIAAREAEALMGAAYPPQKTSPTDAAKILARLIQQSASGTLLALADEAGGQIERVAQRAIALDRSDMNARDLLICGEYLLLGGYLAEACDALGRSIAQGGTAHYHHKAYGWALLRAGKPEAARAALLAALGEWKAEDFPAKADPDHWTAAFLLGEVEREAFSQRWTGTPFAPLPWFYIGQKAEIEGDRDWAASAYRKSIDAGRRQEPRPHTTASWAEHCLSRLTSADEADVADPPGNF